ncbi:undecaprenyl diphosphate synthase family protein [Hydrogenophaga sp.]|uniref:undecaprenyl diphosphate synthase family protein n=1 Tax=Hydrogenophaga sp. TaxID=1904254 RepID=UPI00286D7E64|nr:undecaprenyl diphosphate synthase family protein [Hydrogenophaga sp.]
MTFDLYPATVPMRPCTLKPQPRTLVMPEHVAFVVSGVKAWQHRHHVDESVALASAMRVLMDLVEQCIDQKVPMATLYLFSEDLHDTRPSASGCLLSIFLRFLSKASGLLQIRNVRLRFFGERAALATPLSEWIASAESRSSRNDGMQLNLVLDGQSVMRERPSRAEHLLLGSDHKRATAASRPRVDQPNLVVRTGGRLPFHCAMVWDTSESALFFTDTLWPDFGVPEFDAALRWFRSEGRESGILAKAIH